MVVENTPFGVLESSDSSIPLNQQQANISFTKQQNYGNDIRTGVHPGTNTNTARGTHSGEVQLVNIQLFNLSKIVGTSIFNRYPIPVYLRYAGFPDIHFPYAILDPQGPIGVIGLEAIEFNLCNVEKDEKIYAGSFVRKFETQSKPPIANSTTLDRESQLVKINRVPVDNTHVEHYDLWFEFKDDHAVTQYAMVDPVLQANQRG